MSDITKTAAARNGRKGKLGPCECSKWEVGIDFTEADGSPNMTIDTTGCTKQTNRQFAQGHDAKLKSLFIRAGVEGLDVRTGRGEGMLRTMDWEKAADMFGFGHQVRAAVLARLDKLARKGRPIPPAPKTRDEDERPAPAPEPTPRPQRVRGKVGRWEYEGAELPNGDFAYTNGKGENTVAAAGKWTRLDG